AESKSDAVPQTLTSIQTRGASNGKPMHLPRGSLSRCNQSCRNKSAFRPKSKATGNRLPARVHLPSVESSPTAPATQPHINRDSIPPHCPPPFGRRRPLALLPPDRRRTSSQFCPPRR